MFITDESKRNKRIGETRIMNCGMKATVIAYRKYKDIDVRFIDDVVIKNKSYHDFEKGSICHPNFTKEQKAINRLGESNIMNCGMKATIIAYRKSQDIDVQFEDGVILTGYRYEQFQKGKIPHEKKEIVDPTSRLGESKKMNCGMTATIIEYRNSHDIDIQFEDGIIAKNKYYCDFKNGLIAYRNPDKSKEAPIIKHKKIKSPVTKNNTQKSFIVKHSDINSIPTLNEKNNNTHNNRIGETRTLKCGVKATIIAYRGRMDIDIQLEDGTILTNYNYASFKKGSLPREYISKKYQMIKLVKLEL